MAETEGRSKSRAGGEGRKQRGGLKAEQAAEGENRGADKKQTTWQRTKIEVRTKTKAGGRRSKYRNQKKMNTTLRILLE